MMALDSGQGPFRPPSAAEEGASKIREQKAAVRRQGRRVRQQLPAHLRRWKDERISQSVLASERVAQASTVCLYWSLPEEVGTHSLIRHFIEEGKRVALPCHSTEEALRLVSDPERDLIAARSPGLLEPSPQCPLVPPETVEAFLLPGVAFDVHGHRIGFGGGYFDRVLAQRDPASFAAALAYDCQMFREIPFHPGYDRPVEQIFTEENVYAFRRSEGATQDAEATASLAQRLAEPVARAFRLGLVGPLGVGKTTFIRGFLAQLGVRQAVTSPSFVLMSEYEGWLPVRHIDLYRLGEQPPVEEDLQMFLETIFEFPGVVLVEWANFAHSWLPLWVPQVFLEFQDGGDRRRVILETYSLQDLALHRMFS